MPGKGKRSGAKPKPAGKGQPESLMPGQMKPGPMPGKMMPAGKQMKARKP